MEDCVEIGRMLEMEREEIDFCLWYLNCIGTLMHYTNIADDEDDWFKNHVICSPQVIFDSISQLILAGLRVLHSEGTVIEHEREELIKKGQFSIESIDKYCTSVQVCEKLENEELIPVKQLVKLLNHVNILSPITHTEADGSKRITYLLPAVLECASPEELTTPPPPDANNPEPLYITFSCGYVPTGTFCGLITRLVSLGPHGILGLTWELVEEGVKRNCVSYIVDDVHKVTLLCHERNYEIRITQDDFDISLHDLCAYALSVILYLLGSLYEKLLPLVSFHCPCSEHTSEQTVNHLRALSHKSRVRFICESTKRNVPLHHQQLVWLGKPVTPGKNASLEVLKFAEGDFSYHWTKEGCRHQMETTNVLTINNIREEDLGYYRCEVKEAGRVVLTVYRVLYREESTTSSIEPSPSGESHSEVCAVSSGQQAELEVSHTSGPRAVEKHSMSSDQLDIEIAEEDVTYLARDFDNVELYLRVLGLTPAEQANVRRMVHVHDNQIAMAECLSLWRRHNPSTATLKALLEILLSLRKEEIASKVCDYYHPKHKSHSN